MKKDLGIYIHIPFCARKCAYCDFLSAPATEEVKVQYVKALKKEIEAFREMGQAYETVTVFFGGGTPSLLTGEQLVEILKEVNRCCPIRSGAEITVECNPGTLTEEKLKAYKRAGVSRLSMGLQSAQNEELKKLGRIHTWEEFLISYEMAREKGFGNINVDLMSALPGQRRKTWADTLEQVLKLSPEHISAYSLIIEEGTPFYERYSPGGPLSEELPDEDTERQMYYDTKEILERAGYERYEISNYAKPGYLCRHNLAYWNRTDYKGFGIGAASLLDNVRYQNSRELTAYLRGEFSWESREVLTRKERLEETMFLGLRKMEGVQLTEELTATYEPIFRDLEQKGLLFRQSGRVCLTDKGIDISNYALAEFLLDEQERIK
ncbi:MAG: oxygen-independent coproporphyrinogen III oxidase [Lachnospiraceae bacterium]|nr:oxygen-independent coproporphyrinogen III oxidase [Lachnospiraceae bacterium]